MNRSAQTNNQGLEERAETFQFGEFRIDVERRVLLRRDTRIRIQKKPLAVLIYLIEQAPRMVPRDELLERFWSRSVNEEVLTRCLSTIRGHLEDNDDPPRFIETYRGEGYRFIAELAGAPEEPRPPLSSPLNYGARILAAVVLVSLIIAVTMWRDDPPQATTDSRIQRIAVLPLSTGDDTDNWVRPALSDHLMRAISRIEGITVVSSNAEPNDVDVQAHGRQLNVEALLFTRLDPTTSGSVLGARLLAVDDGSLLWSATVDSEYEFSSGEQVAELSQQLAIRLRPTLQLGERRANVDQRAYSYYLQGRYYWAQRSSIGLEAAIAAFDAALAIENTYADALLGSAESWLLLPLYGAMAPDEAIPRARELARRAMELDPVSGRARAVMGVIAMQYDWDWREAETLLLQAVTLNPNDATAQQWLGEVFCYTSRFDECLRQFQIAYDLDPLSPVLQMQQGTPALYSGNYSTAVARYEDAVEDAPEFAMGRYALGLAYAGNGDWQSAISAYRASRPELGIEIVGGPLVFALSRSGADADAQRVLDELEASAAERYVPPSKLAVAYLGVGDRDRAIAELNRAVDVHDDRLVYYVNDVHFRDLIEEDGFREVAERIGH